MVSYRLKYGRFILIGIFYLPELLVSYHIIIYFHTKTYTSKSESNLQNKAYLQQ